MKSRMRSWAAWRMLSSFSAKKARADVRSPLQRAFLQLFSRFAALQNAHVVYDLAAFEFSDSTRTILWLLWSWLDPFAVVLRPCDACWCSAGLLRATRDRVAELISGPSGSHYCPGLHEQQCRFSTLRIGERARIHPDRDQFSAIYSSLTASERRVLTGVANIFAGPHDFALCTSMGKNSEATYFVGQHLERSRNKLDADVNRGSG